MTHEEAIAAREVLVAEQRKLNQAIKIMQSDSIPPCAGVTMAIGQYRRRLAAIDNDIREIAEQYQLELEATDQPVEAVATAEEPVVEQPTVETVQETTVSVAEEAPAPAEAPQTVEAPAPAAQPQPTMQEMAIAQLLLGLFRQTGVITQ